MFLPLNFSLVVVSIEKMYQAVKTVFDYIFKNLEVRQKYSATLRIFNSLLSVLKCCHTLSFVFDIFLRVYLFGDRVEEKNVECMVHNVLDRDQWSSVRIWLLPSCLVLLLFTMHTAPLFNP